MQEKLCYAVIDRYEEEILGKELLIVTDSKRRAVFVRNARYDDAGGKADVEIEEVRGVEEALRVAYRAIRRGNRPSIEIRGVY